MAISDNVRVRFAPSPTGYLHIGSARTALFNYLFAKHNGGKLVLRIEDTDQMRSTVDALKNIIQGLLWLNIKWDEGPGYELPAEGEDFTSYGDYGPYFQAARGDKHRAHAARLIEEGKAYWCLCPPMENYGTSKCECVGRQEAIPDKSLASIKFSIPEGVTVVDDMIRGRVEFENNSIPDFLIVRPSGHATYNFAVVCDDIDMKISHVLRGEDHLSNTPKQIMVFNALGADIPRFGHIPLIHGDDGVRLSKRHGAVSTEWYRDEGYLRDAFVNYLARLGWSDGTEEEFFTLKELEEKFELKDVTKSPAKFDMNKLVWFNGNYLRKMGSDALLEGALPFIVAAGLINLEELTPGKKDWLKSVLELYRVRVETLKEIPEAIEYFFNDPKEYLVKDLEKAKVDSEAKAYLRDILAMFEQTEDFSDASLEALIHKFCEDRGIGLGRLAHPLRLAVTGRRATPGLYETLRALGKKRVVRRLGKFLKKVDPVCE